MGSRKKTQEPKSPGAQLLRAVSAGCSDAKEPLAYLDGLRSALLYWGSKRLAEAEERTGDFDGLQDPMGKQLEDIRRRFDELAAICRGFLMLMPAEGKADRAVADELLASIEGLMGLELEARAMQARIAHSAVVQDYIHGNRFGAPFQGCELTFDVDKLTAERFRLLRGRISGLRASEFGRHGGLAPEDLLGHLVGFGSGNLQTLAALWVDGLERVKVGDADGFQPVPGRRLTFLVDEYVPRQFGLLKSEVEGLLSGKLKGRRLDASELLSMLLVLGEANARLIAALGAPTLTAIPFCVRGER